jgi:type IV secretory pathway component VirB8
LDATPELFLRLPKRDGITRYRVTSSATARSHEEVEALLRKAERNESLLFYAIAFMVLAMLAIVVLTIAPNL